MCLPALEVAHSLCMQRACENVSQRVSLSATLLRTGVSCHQKHPLNPVKSRYEIEERQL